MIRLTHHCNLTGVNFYLQYLTFSQAKLDGYSNVRFSYFIHNFAYQYTSFVFRILTELTLAGNYRSGKGTETFIETSENVVSYIYTEDQIV